ncbi:MAG: carboxypeptidase regulatory-like domain-containing protein, partial [Candidatus Acidiferrales bacterium]
MKTLTVFLCVVVCSILAATAAMAQISGGVAGNVYDPTKAIVAGAQVTLRDAQTAAARQMPTSTEGYFEFTQLRPATYELTVEAAGFRRVLERNIVVNAGQIAHVDVFLELGNTSETVEVTAEIPLIEPERTAISRSVDIKMIMSLPMLARQILNLALTVPGTIPGAPGTQVVGFSVAGMRSQSNNYTLDGISNNDPQVNGPLDAFRLTDAIQEFTVQTSIASPDVGRNSGAQVSIITKSGGNSYHGSVFYYGRNDALDANDFFLNRAGQPKNALSRHQFGGTAGGYIFKDKTFWFFSYEGFRENFQQPITARVPTDAERNAITDPVSLRVLNFYPKANTSFVGGINFTGTTVSTTNNDTYLWRIDQKLTNNHRLMGRYAWFRGFTDALQNGSGSGPFNGNITNAPGQHSFVLAETWATSRFVNEAKVGYSRNRTFFAPTDVALNPAKIFTDAAGNPLPGFVDATKDSLDGGLPNITIAGIASLGAGTNMPQGRATNTYEAIDNVSLVSPFGWSRHTLRFGAEYRHEITNRFLNGNYRGQISFACLNAVDLRSADPNAQAPCSP